MELLEFICYNDGGLEYYALFNNRGKAGKKKRLGIVEVKSEIIHLLLTEIGDKHKTRSQTN